MVAVTNSWRKKREICKNSGISNDDCKNGIRRASRERRGLFLKTTRNYKKETE